MPARSSPRRRPYVALGALLLASCSEVGDTRRFVADLDPIELVKTRPLPGGMLAQGMPILLCLSDLVDPETVSDTEALVGSGSVIADVRTDVQLFAWGSLPASETPWCRGSVITVTPQEPLAPGVTWRLQWTPDLRGWSGASLETTGEGWLELQDQTVYVLEFRAADAEVSEPLPTPALRDLFAAGAIFDPEQGRCSCHQSPGEDAHTLLDLSSPERAYDALVLPSRLRDTGVPMVTPGRPSESFLLHKLLRNDEGGALRGVLGRPMPPDHPLPYPDLVAVARWILAGAEL